VNPTDKNGPEGSARCSLEPTGFNSHAQHSQEIMQNEMTKPRLVFTSFFVVVTMTVETVL
jgi:hypothetical protein